MHVRSLRSAPAVVLAAGSLVVALGGASYAAAKISGADIKKHSIAGNRLKSNTLTGAQINESKLGKVPQAKKADRATLANNSVLVDGAVVIPFHRSMGADDAAQTVSFPGGTVTASCPSHVPSFVLSGDLTADADVTANWVGNDFFSASPDFNGGDDAFTTASSDSLVHSSPTTGVGTVVIARPNDGSTTISYSYETIESGCIFAGTVIATP